MFGLFLAPAIDNNTANTFKQGVWYRGEEELKVQIVPMTLEDFITVLEAAQRRVHDIHRHLPSMLDRCWRHSSASPPEWKRMITATIATAASGFAELAQRK